MLNSPPLTSVNLAAHASHPNNGVMPVRRLAPQLLLAASAAMIAHHAAASTVPLTLTLHDGEPVRLRLARDLTFTNVKPGELADFEILEDLRIGGVLIMAHGMRATASVTAAETKARGRRDAKLGVNLASVPLSNGGSVAVRAARQRPAPPEGAVTAAGAPAVLRPSAAPLLFAFGKGDVFPAGTEITAFIDGEIQLDPSAFLLDVTFTSDPPGAVVSIYGAPVARTPFTTRLAVGTYKTLFSTDGYREVPREIAVGPGRSNTVHVAFPAKP